MWAYWHMGPVRDYRILGLQEEKGRGGRRGQKGRTSRDPSQPRPGTCAGRGIYGWGDRLVGLSRYVITMPAECASSMCRFT